MNNSDALKFLGLDTTAKPDEVKKAYKKAAAKYHPDVCKDDDAADNFKRAQEAYDVLSKPKVKIDLSRSVRFPTAKIDLTITFDESITGVKKNVVVETYVKCNDCDGNGIFGYEGSCTQCNGRGKDTRNVGGGMVFVTDCHRCFGSGKKIESCSSCSGQGANLEKRSLDINFPGGVSNKQEVRVLGAGHYMCDHFGGKNNDALFVRAIVGSKDNMTLDGRDVFSHLDVLLKDAVFGTDKEVDTVYGKKTLSIPKKAKHRDLVRIKGCGAKTSGGTGDHVFQLNVEYPENIEEILS